MRLLLEAAQPKATGRSTSGGHTPEGPQGHEPLQHDGARSDASSLPPSVRTPPETGTLRVLIVDDEPAIRSVLDAVFQRDDRFEIVGVAVDGHEAIEQTRHLRPDVVLLDLMMPGLSGNEALPTILEDSPRSMVIALSALPADDAEDDTLAAGAFAYLEKSVLGPALPREVFEQHQRFEQA